MPTVSIIIPVYNAAKYLRECLDSVSNQEYKDWECILVNDCSTDNSSEIIKKYQNKDSRFIVIDNEVNLGVSGARYKGISSAKGEWVAFIDNDDVVSSKYLQSMINAQRNYTDADMVCCNNFEFEDGKNIVWPNVSNDIKKISGEEALNILHFDNKFNMNAIWCKLIRKERILKFDYIKYKKEFPLCFFEDGFVIPIILMNEETIICIKDCLYANRYSNRSLSRSTSSAVYSINQVRSALVIFEKYQNYNEDLQKKYYEAIVLGIIKSYFCSKKEKKIREEAAALFDKLYLEGKKYKNINKYTAFNMKLFNFSHFLWCITIGWFYFDILPYFPSIYKKARICR